MKKYWLPQTHVVWVTVKWAHPAQETARHTLHTRADGHAFVSSGRPFDGPVLRSVTQHLDACTFLGRSDPASGPAERKSCLANRLARRPKLRRNRTESDRKGRQSLRDARRGHILGNTSYFSGGSSVRRIAGRMDSKNASLYEIQ
eukprot:549669-Prorocentrum_minimum.AAC.5